MNKGSTLIIGSLLIGVGILLIAVGKFIFEEYGLPSPIIKFE